MSESLRSHKRKHKFGKIGLKFFFFFIHLSFFFFSKLLENKKKDSNKIGLDGCSSLYEILVSEAMGIYTLDLSFFLSFINFHDFLKTDHYFAGYNEIGDEGCQKIIEALANTTRLSRLDLCFLIFCFIFFILNWINSFCEAANKLGNAECKTLADSLKKNSSLLQINLGFSWFAFFFSQKEGNSNFFFFSDSNDIGDEGCFHLAEVLQTNQTLSQLDLGLLFFLNLFVVFFHWKSSFFNFSKGNNENITDAGLQTLCEALKKNNSLVSIKLSSLNKTTAAVADSFAAMLKENSTLSQLDLCIYSSFFQNFLLTYPNPMFFFWRWW